MPPVSDRQGEREYWRTLEELAETPEYKELLHREFPEGADLPPQDFSRRRFLQLMGASITFAGFSGCSWPKEEIVPYAHRPEGLSPGVTRRFATTIDDGFSSNGLLVTSYDGRPIKIEGNPGHPIGGGKTDLLAQASVLDVYDPDRSRRVVRRSAGQEVTTGWEEFERSIAGETARLWDAGGAGLAVLTEGSSSPASISPRLRS